MTFDRPPDFSQRGWKEVLRAAMRVAAEHWHAEMLPRHFTQTARGRYGYQPRTVKYQRRKVVGVMTGKLASAYDMVYTGQTRVAAAKPPRIRAFPTRARLDLLVPPYISMRPNPHGRRAAAPALGDELTRVTYEESQELAGVAAAHCESRIGSHRSTMQSYTVVCE